MNIVERTLTCHVRYSAPYSMIHCSYPFHSFMFLCILLASDDTNIKQDKIHWILEQLTKDHDMDVETRINLTRALIYVSLGNAYDSSFFLSILLTSRYRSFW